MTGTPESKEGREAAGARRVHGYLEGVDGIRLFHRSWEVESPRRRVVLVHGLGDHSGRYVRLGRDLASRGCRVLAPDLRGHGRSRGRRGWVRRFGDLLRDLDRVRRRASLSPGGPRPVSLVGHSLGGLLVLRYAQEFAAAPVHRVVAVAPFVRLAAPVPGWKLALADVADRMAPALTLDSGMDGELLFRDPEERETHRSDPLVHHRISARLWAEMRRSAATVRSEAARIAAPVLFQVPGDDRVVDPEAVVELAGSVGANARVRRYPGAYHALYHDPAGDRARDDAAGWILDRGATGDE